MMPGGNPWPWFPGTPPPRLGDGSRVTVRVCGRLVVGLLVSTGAAEGEAPNTARGWRIDLPDEAHDDPPGDEDQPVVDPARSRGVADRRMVRSIDDADQWVRVHTRWAVQDIDRLVDLTDRVRILELPWWRRRRWRRRR